MSPLFMMLGPVAAEAGAPGAAAGDPVQAQGRDDRRLVDVVEIDGPIDRVQEDFIEEALQRAERGEIEVLVFRINSPGSLDVDSLDLARRVRDLPVPVVSWVGEGGATARGDAMLFALASDLLFMAPEATLGDFNPGDLVRNEDVTAAEWREIVDELNTNPGRNLEAWLPLREGAVAGEAAAGDGIVEGTAPIIGQVLVDLDEREVVLADGEVIVMDTAQVVEGPEGTPQREPTVITRFFRISYVPNFFHKANTPTYAYVLFVAGLAAIVFEFYAASIGLAGIIGALCLLVSFVGMGNLPVNWWAVALLAFGVFLLSADVQIMTLGPLSVLGTIAAIVGSVFFTYSDVYDVRWWAIILTVGGLVLFYAIVMTTIMRTRFATPTIGREHLVGLEGTTTTQLAPDGLVSIDGAVWKARSHRGTIDRGSPVTVRIVDGFVLEVDSGSPVAGDD